MAQSTDLFVRALTHILVKNGSLPTKEERPIDEAFRKSENERFDDFLLQEGLVEPEELLRALSEYYKVPPFDVSDYFFEHHLLHLFPKDLLLEFAIIPAEQDDDILLVVAADPSNPELLAAIGDIVSYDIQFCVGIYQDICDMIEEFYDRSPTEVDESEEPFSADDHLFQTEIDKTGAEVDEMVEINKEGIVIGETDLDEDFEG